ncbi:predicted protein [Coccidioides posadasii C735 delta SOWgp]|uniref:Fungal N-terminal domain-containing protein n=1 Tax=Coccidioides posadasii (strain C735) TaxID=222929 RepID=C5P1V1_COCP7|nr:predicted protein [Coccidioides posadasii C735 delta SOWgp]EER28854.1 predicted protein [Coccidioides posadasii C735 delta SOWgp]|eukprot:XP_003070999.1 predicted protein [Coccidioides posadasii C735 delta SOWgp]
MSGFEIVGIIAGASQLVDLGTRLSCKLVRCYLGAKSSDTYLQHLANDVALTSSILADLKENFGDSEHAQLYSPMALKAAEETVAECTAVFKEIERKSDHAGLKHKMTRWQRAKRGFSIMRQESDLSALGNRLHDLKLNMILLVQTSISAAQHRRAVLDEMESSKAGFNSPGLNLQSSQAGRSAEASGLKGRLPFKLRSYYDLMKGILEAIDSARDLRDRARQHRLRNGVLKIHAIEAKLFRQKYGIWTRKVFAGHLFQRKRKRMGTKCLRAVRVVHHLDAIGPIEARDSTYSSDIEEPPETADIALSGVERLLLEWTTLTLEEIQQKQSLD